VEALLFKRWNPRYVQRKDSEPQRGDTGCFRHLTGFKFEFNKQSRTAKNHPKSTQSGALKTVHFSHDIITIPHLLCRFRFTRLESALGR
jgi:hypothetical protein